MIRSIRGTKDILPDESGLWQELEAASRNILKRYGYKEIRTPIIEETALFIKNIGADTPSKPPYCTCAYLTLIFSALYIDCGKVVEADGDCAMAWAQVVFVYLKGSF